MMGLTGRHCLVLFLFGFIGFCSATDSSINDELSASVVTLTVPFKEGGGTDTWARFIAPYLSRYLPGNPQVQVKNHPGGGSTKAVNRYAATAPKDGKALLGISGTTQIAYILGDSRVRYDYSDWHVLMVYPTGGVVYVDSALGVRNARDISKLAGKNLVFGSQGPTSLDLVPMLMFELLNLKVRPIFGMRGRGAGRLTFERGQANIDFQTTAAYIANVLPLVESGKAVPLFSLGILNNEGELIRDPQFPTLPHVGEVLEWTQGTRAKGIEWESWFALYTAGFGAQKLLVLPKQTPKKTVEIYQQAINQLLADKQYIAESVAVLGRYQQVTGASAQKLYLMATHIPEQQIQWIRNWLRNTYEIKI